MEEHTMVRTHTENISLALSRQQTPGPDHTGQAPTRPSRRAPARRRTAHDPLEAACRLLNRASTWQAQGRYDRAATAARRALALGERAVGPDHPDVANILITLASIAEAQGDYAAAERQARRAVAIMEQVTGPGEIVLLHV